MKQQFTTVLARGFAASHRTVRVRALNDEEIQELLLLARNTEWWGNRLLIDFVLTAGLNGDEAARTQISSDWVLGLNLAREIWIVTLRAIARRARALGGIAGIARRIPFIRRYRFRDLITPGMLLMIEERTTEIDVVGFTKDMLNAAVADIIVRGRKLPRARRRKMINESFDSLVPTILETWGIDKSLFETLPQEVLPTPSHRFFAALQLAETLDWQQYHRLLNYYHAAVEDLLFRSRQLGGSDAIRAETHLATVMPRFPEVIMPMRNVPFEVCAQLFIDAEEDRLKGFAPKSRVLLRNKAKQVLRRIIDSVPNLASAPEEVRKEAVGREMIWFLNEVGRNPRFVERACYIYFDQFRKAFGRVPEKSSTGD